MIRALPFHARGVLTLGSWYSAGGHPANCECHHISKYGGKQSLTSQSKLYSLKSILFYNTRGGEAKVPQFRRYKKARCKTLIVIITWNRGNAHIHKLTFFHLKILLHLRYFQHVLWLESYISKRLILHFNYSLLSKRVKQNKNSCIYIIAK